MKVLNVSNWATSGVEAVQVIAMELKLTSRPMTLSFAKPGAATTELRRHGAPVSFLDALERNLIEEWGAMGPTGHPIDCVDGQA